MSEISSEQRPAPQAPLWAESQRRICILGSTGSIGTQALDVVRTAAASADQQDPFRVVALAAGSSNLELLAEPVLAKLFASGYRKKPDMNEIEGFPTLPFTVVPSLLEHLFRLLIVV